MDQWFHDDVDGDADDDGDDHDDDDHHHDNHHDEHHDDDDDHHHHHDNHHHHHHHHVGTARSLISSTNMLNCVVQCPALGQCLSIMYNNGKPMYICHPI